MIHFCASGGATDRRYDKTRHEPPHGMEHYGKNGDQNSEKGNP